MLPTLLTAAEVEALLLSLRIGAAAVAFSLPLAIVAAFVLARGRFPGRLLLDGLIHVPLVLPPVVLGYLLLLTFGTRAPVGAWLLETFGIRFAFSWTGAVLASAVLTFPFQVRAIRVSLDAVDPGLEAAARSLGAGRFDIFFTITLPLILPGILAGAITAFAAALGEFGAIITFVSNIPGETRTLTLAIYTAIQSPGGEMAAARLASLSIILALGGLILSEVVRRRMQRRIGH
ncbi:MAG: molybdate ABC transporter permease subunit [Rhodospirillales bacterium]